MRFQVLGTRCYEAPDRSHYAQVDFEVPAPSLTTEGYSCFSVALGFSQYLPEADLLKNRPPTRLTHTM